MINDGFFNRPRAQTALSAPPRPRPAWAVNAPTTGPFRFIDYGAPLPPGPTDAERAFTTPEAQSALDQFDPADVAATLAQWARAGETQSAETQEDIERRLRIRQEHRAVASKKAIEECLKHHRETISKQTELICTAFDKLALDTDETFADHPLVSSLKCPISLCAMRDPVATSDGQCYERSQIDLHFKHSGLTSPMTNKAVDVNLYPNQPVKQMIEWWVWKTLDVPPGEQTMDNLRYLAQIEDDDEGAGAGV